MAQMWIMSILVAAAEYEASLVFSGEGRGARGRSRYYDVHLQSISHVLLTWSWLLHSSRTSNKRSAASDSFSCVSMPLSDEEGAAKCLERCRSEILRRPPRVITLGHMQPNPAFACRRLLGTCLISGRWPPFRAAFAVIFRQVLPVLVTFRAIRMVFVQ